MRFCSFTFFVSGSVSFVVFFSVLLVSGSLFENIFGSELLFLGFGVGRVYSGAVFLYFCFIIWFVVPENVSRKLSSGQVRCLNKFSGANFCFMVSGLVCWQLFPFSKGEMLSVFFCVFFVSGSVSFVVFYRSSFLRVVVWKNFRERTFVFVCRCGSCVFWCCFAYVFALLFAFSLPKLSRKNSLDVRSGVFWLSSFFLWFFRRRRLFFLREKA